MYKVDNSTPTVKLHTKWGTAKLNAIGYYVITTKTEGNANKLLHRLIFEDFYGCEVPKGYVIHHKDENKLNNCILNLQLLKRSIHQKLHMEKNPPMKGKKHGAESKYKISQSGKNRVVSEDTKRKISNFHKGKKRSEETRKNISESLKGRTLSEEHKKKLSESRKGYVMLEKQKQKLSKSISKSKSTTGIYRVSKHKNNGVKQGFVYRYNYKKSGKQKCVTSVNLEKLEEKVKSKGLPWIVFEDGGGIMKPNFRVVEGELKSYWDDYEEFIRLYNENKIPVTEIRNRLNMKIKKYNNYRKTAIEEGRLNIDVRNPSNRFHGK